MGGFLILVLVVEQNIATKWYYNCSPGLNFGAIYIVFEPGPFKGVLGPSLAGKRPKTKTQILILVS